MHDMVVDLFSHCREKKVCLNSDFFFFFAQRSDLLQLTSNKVYAYSGCR